MTKTCTLFAKCIFLPLLCHCNFLQVEFVNCVKQKKMMSNIHVFCTNAFGKSMNQSLLSLFFFFYKVFFSIPSFLFISFKSISSKVSPALLSKMRKNWNCFLHCFNFCKHFPYLSGFSRGSAKYFEAFIFLFLEQIRTMHIPPGLKEFFYTICTFETLNMAMKT